MLATLIIVFRELLEATQRPSAMQIIFYLATLAAIGSLMWWVNRPRPVSAATARSKS